LARVFDLETRASVQEVRQYGIGQVVAAVLASVVSTGQLEERRCTVDHD
jgi:hypothetical protein